MSKRQIIVVGGGAAGFFAAIAAAELGADVTLLEKTARFLDKVRISGGGRCNVTHACFEPREFATRYPRGERALLAPFQKFSARDTVDWFAARGVKMKTESDGRMFPVTNTSQTIVDCLMSAAEKAGVKLRLNCGVESITKRPEGGFELTLARSAPVPGAVNADTQRAFNLLKTSGTFPIAAPGDGRTPAETIPCDRLLLATGGCRAAAAGQLAVALGHTLAAPVPSLFTFQIESPWLRSLAGVAVESEVSVPVAKLRESGPLLLTHWGLSGPAILKMSAWGARALHDLDYKFPLFVNWLPHLSVEKIAAELASRRNKFPAKYMGNNSFAPLPLRLWEQLVLAAGIARETRWSVLTRAQTHALTQQLSRSEFSVTGKSLNKDEFVTCGGVKLGEVNFKTMESKVCPGLFFAGELLDIDGITGGFNFQAAWTTGFLAGNALAASL